jgi:hypothetical protein
VVGLNTNPLLAAEHDNRAADALARGNFSLADPKNEVGRAAEQQSRVCRANHCFGG